MKNISKNNGMALLFGMLVLGLLTMALLLLADLLRMHWQMVSRQRQKIKLLNMHDWLQHQANIFLQSENFKNCIIPQRSFKQWQKRSRAAIQQVLPCQMTIDGMVVVYGIETMASELCFNIGNKQYYRITFQINNALFNLPYQQLLVVTLPDDCDKPHQAANNRLNSLISINDSG